MNLSLFPLTGAFHQLTRQLGHMNYQLRSRGIDAATDPQFNRTLQMHMSLETVSCDPDVLSSCVAMYEALADVLVRMLDRGGPVGAVPEFLVEDCCTLLNFVATERAVPAEVLSQSVTGIFTLVIKLLSPEHSGTVKNYNLRAKLGDILYNVFLPPSEKNDEGPSHSSAALPPFCLGPGGVPLLIGNPDALKTLAPSLLLLYGEVELTGYYERQGYRSRICSLLRYLWFSNACGPAFSAIAEDSTGFVKFANGVLNETNELVGTMMDKLPQIKHIQDEMRSAEWGTLSQARQDEVTQRLSEHEQLVKSAILLCNKTLSMFAFLSTNAAIANLFQGPELCTRLVNVLLYVAQNMLGSKGLELKVDNPEQYYWRPKELLGDLVAILCCYADSSSISSAIAASGYYNDKLLPKLIKTATKLQLPSASTPALERLSSAVASAREGAVDMDSILEDAPDDFLDPLTCEVMRDPVRLPTSDTVVDRSTIAQQLLNDPVDPFNRQPLKIEDVVDDEELKERIDAFIEEKKEEMMALKLSMS